MKNNFEHEIYDSVSFPIIIIRDDLSVEYCNDVAKQTHASICREGSLRSFLSNEATSISRKLKRGEIVKIKGNFGSYLFMTMIPYVSDGKCLAFVLAEHSFSVYKSTDGFRDEKSIADAFASEYSIYSRRINGSIEYIKQISGDSSLRNMLPYLANISKSVSQVDGMVENLIAVMRLQTLFSEKEVECVNILRFLADTDRVHGVLDLSELHDDSIEILYNKNELSTVCSDIIAFLLEDSGGETSVKVSVKQTGSHILLSFSVPSQKRSFPINNAFELQNANRKSSLFFVRKTVERRGGNVIFRKNGSRYEVMFSVRKMLPQTYSGYLADESSLIDIL